MSVQNKAKLTFLSNATVAGTKLSGGSGLALP